MSFRSQITSTRWIEVERPVVITDAGRQPADHGSQPSPSVMVMVTREAQATVHPLALRVREVPLAGKVSMDTITVDVTDAPNLGG